MTIAAPKLPPFLFLALAALFWASNLIVGKILQDKVPPVTLSLLRQIVCLAVVLPFAIPHLKAVRSVLAQRFGLVLLLGATGIALPHTVIYVALHSTQAINVALLNAAAPVAVLIIAWLIARTKSNVREIVGIAVSLLGTVVLITRADAGVLLSLEFYPGDLLAVVAILSISIYTVVLGTRPIELHPAVLLAAMAGVAVMVLIPIAAVEVATGPSWALTPRLLVVIVYVGVAPSALALACWNRGLRDMRAPVAGQAIHLVPVFTVLLAIPVLGEPVHAYHVLAFALIATGVGIANRWVSIGRWGP
jgi:drug/metabolite transporter (DMT)-like permease